MTLRQLLYPGATQRPVSYSREAHPMTAYLGWILHVTVMNGSPYNVFSKAEPPHRRFSHWWVGKDGRMEQYAIPPLSSWAQVQGNGTYLSVETEGFPEEPLTDAQLDRLAAFHVWTGLPDALANHPGERGIGTHYMGGAAWGGHSCPDPVSHEGAGPRSRQRGEILRRAALLRHPHPTPTAGDDVTAQDVWTEQLPPAPGEADPTPRQAGAIVAATRRNTEQIINILEEILTRLKAPPA